MKSLRIHSLFAFRFMTRRFFLAISIIWILSFSSLNGKEAIEIQGGVEENNNKIYDLLIKLTDNSVKDIEKTLGFNFRYQAKWYSPFTYDIFIGKVNKDSKNTLLRIEASKLGEAKVIRQIIEAEILKTPVTDGRQMKKKSHILSILFNATIPAIGVGYNSINSPLYQGMDTTKRVLVYLLLDLVLGGAAYYYIDKHPVKKTVWDNLLLKKGHSGNVFASPHAGVMIVALGVTRLYRLSDSWNETRLQNHLVELSYMYKF